MIDRGLAMRLRHYATLRDRDPLTYWQHASDESRAATRWLHEAEVYCRWPNWTGKTTWGAAAVVSMLQGREALNGIPLPRIRKPAAAALSLDYEQQKFSVQPAYLAAVGEWPHKLAWKGDGILSTLRVQPLGGGDDPMRWPMVTFVSQENPRAGTGARVPIVHADEPPKETIWREFRKSARFGERGVRLITATPLIRSQWWWLKSDFEGCYGVPYRGRVEVHMTDVRHASIVTPKRYQELLDEYRGDPLIEARLTAAYVDVTGDSPFAGLEHVLTAMLAECVTPELHEWNITREVDGESGRSKVMERVRVEVFRHWVKGQRCYIPIDPSLGINSERHDPGALHVRDAETGDLLARYNGYIGAYGLGVLAAGLARQYGDAVVDPETTGGYGGPCLTALTDCGYRNVAQQKRELTPGQWETQLGFKTTIETRPAMFSAIQEWLKAWDAGFRYANCPSAEVIRSLQDLTLDARGKPLAAPGLHDEDPILWGQGLRVLKPPYKRPEAKVRPSYVPQTISQLRERLNGRVGQRVPPPRMRERH